MEFKIFTSDYEVIANGNVVFPFDSYVEFNIKNLKYRISFKNDDTNESHYVGHVKDKDTPNAYMDITFYNIPDMTFAIPTNNIELGALDGKKIFFRFSVSIIHHSDNTDDILLVYNWLKER